MTNMFSSVSPAMLRSSCSHGLRCLSFLAAAFTLTLALGAAEPARKQFSIPSGEASKSLELFSEQAGTQVVFLLEEVRGVTTNAAKGEMTPREALEVMLDGTGLQVVEDPQNKTLVIRPKAAPGSGRAPAKPTATSADAAPEEVVQLTPFEVSTQKDAGYRKTMSTTSSRTAVEVVKNPQAVEIISGELLEDFGVTNIWEAFRYSSSVTVIPNAVALTNQFNMRGFQVPIYINGISIPNIGATYVQMVTDNIERIEIAKGPIGLYYGVSTPNGVANYITKKPAFQNATKAELSGGNFGYAKAMVDTQTVLSRKYGVAYRLIASYVRHDGRVDGQLGDDTFVAPSIIVRPNDKIEISTEYNYNTSHRPYATNVYTFAINPQYYTDYQNPSAEVLQYFKNTYALATDDAARAKLVERWGPTQTWATWLGNWVADTYARTGTQPFYWSGSQINWWRLSPNGDAATFVTPESNTDGTRYLLDSAVTFTPVRDLSIKYRWLQTQSNTAFDRELINPRGGLRPDGRFISMTLASGLTHQAENIRYVRNSTQQLDLAYQLEALGMKHTLSAGLQDDRSVEAFGAATVDFTKAKSILDASGNVVIDNSTGVPVALTGANVYNYWDPWGSRPPGPLYDVIASEGKVSTYNVTKYQAYYLSYRGSALNDRLNVLAGMRHTKSVNLGRSDNTPTLGAIYEVMPGFHAFASWSKSLTFTTQMSITGLGVVPADNAHLLDNETDEGFEVGLKTDWRDNTLSGTLSYYRDDRDGVVLNDAYATLNDPRTLTNDPNQRVAYYVNGGLQRGEGLDMDLSWTPNRDLQILVSGNYMWTAKILSDPSLNPTQTKTSTYIKVKTIRLAGAPEYSGKLVAKYHIPDGMFKDWSIGGAVRYSDMWEYSNAGIIHVTVPAETVFDLFATWSTKLCGIPTTYKLNLINLGDTYNDITRDDGFKVRFSMGFEF